MVNEKPKWEKPPWVKPRIVAAPKIRQIYWCDFWKDAQLPDMWKTRPVIVISFKNTLHGTCLVVPTSTDPGNEHDPLAVPLFRSSRRRPELVGDLQSAFDRCGQPAFPVQVKNPQTPSIDFNQVLAMLIKLLPEPFVIEN